MVVSFVLLTVSVTLAVAADPVLLRPNDLRYDYLPDADGVPHLVDSWLKLSDLERMARYNPDRDNEYHLFTRQNPTVSQPLLNGNLVVLNTSNFRANRRTVILLHGWMGHALASSNTVLAPALLAAEDLNVIIVDWRIGAAQPSFPNALASARSVAGFLNWLSTAVGVTGDNMIIIGFSLGGQQAGMIGRHTNQRVSYIVALDPPKRGFDFEFRPDDGVYTEVIHTNVNGMGSAPTGQVDFYPNGGDNNPGCGVGGGCNHSRAYHFMAESIVSGGFTGVECETYQQALNGNCNLPRTLPMGGLTPKTGTTGIFYLQTNASPPFSRG